MDRHSSIALHQRRGTVAEVIAINVIWPCALGVFGAGLATQSAGLALQGLALFFATYFYVLLRIYQLRAPDTDAENIHPIGGALNLRASRQREG